MQVIWLKTALKNLDDIAIYIAQENPLAASRLVEKVITQVNLLNSQPALGRPGRVHGTRELVITNTPYVVPYRIKNNTVEVLRVFHAARKPPQYW